jgi:crotonobetainyl-CoA:carnitine CoA-transferase CaiB-like acyl-CoA transferase
MEQTPMPEAKKIITTRCPIRFNGERLYSKTGANVGEHNEKVMKELVGVRGEWRVMSDELVEGAECVTR